MALDLWQDLLKQFKTPLPAWMIPRLIHALHFSTFSQKTSPEVTFNEHLAAAIIVELSGYAAFVPRK